MVGVGARPGGGRQPDDEPAAARCWSLAVLAFVVSQPAQRRAVGAGLPVLLPVRAGRGRDPRRVPHGVRHRDHRAATTSCSRLPTVHAAELVRRDPARRPGVARGDAVRRRRRAAAGHPAVLHRRGQRAGQPEARAARPARARCTSWVSPWWWPSASRRSYRERAARPACAAAARPTTRAGCGRCARSPSRSSRTRSSGRCASPPRWTRAATAAAGPRPPPAVAPPRCCCRPGCSACASGRTACWTPTAPRLLGVRRRWLLGGALCVRGLALGGRRVSGRELPARPVAAARVGRRPARRRRRSRRRGQPSRTPPTVNPSFYPLPWPQLPARPGGRDPAGRPGRRRRAAATAPPPRRSDVARTSSRSTGRRRDRARSPRPRGRADDRLRPRHGHLPGGHRPVLRDVDLTPRRGRAVPGRRPDRRRQVHAARRDQRAGAALHRRARCAAGSASTAATPRTHPPRELADVVGVVGQDPLAGFVTDTVEEELAYGMEQLARARRTSCASGSRRRSTCSASPTCAAARCTSCPAASSSGSRSARCSPRTRGCCVLDEPTSALDPTAAEEVLAAITRLVHDLGVTVVLAEHRLERVVQYADRVVHVPGDGTVVDGDRRPRCWRPPTSRRRSSSWAGWPAGQPLPLSVRDARRLGRAAAGPAGAGRRAAARRRRGGDRRRPALGHARRGPVRRPGRGARGRPRPAAGEVVALMGRNGVGQVVAAVGAAGHRAAARRLGRGRRPATPRDLSAAARPARWSGWCRRTPADLLYLETVDDEWRRPTASRRRPPGRRGACSTGSPPASTATLHPRDLSEGQRLALVLAVQLSAAPRVVLLDEPTRGLDYRGQGRRCARSLGELAADGQRSSWSAPTTSSSSPRPPTGSW